MSDPANAPVQIPPGKKVCPYCGRLTSVDANFCWFCARELVARPEHPAEEPRSSRTPWLVLLVLILVVIAVVFIWSMQQ